MSNRRTVAALLVSATVATVVRKLPTPSAPGWTRTNFRGRSVSLSGGLAAATGAVAGSLLAGSLRRPALLAAGSALIAGAYDDLLAPRAEQVSDKGLAGHLRALRARRLSGGAVKVILIGAGSTLAALSMPSRTATGWCARVTSIALIAGSANLVNLFDVRPGRAGKVALALSAGSLGGGLSRGGVGAAVAGATLATLPDDLGERTMLGDLGANTLGALIGVQLATRSQPTRLVAVAVVSALTLASERVSFTAVIAAVPPLRWLDELGRSMSPPPAALPMRHL